MGLKRNKLNLLFLEFTPFSSNTLVSSKPSKTQSNIKNDSANSINNEGVKWDSSPLVPDTDDIPF